MGGATCELLTVHAADGVRLEGALFAGVGANSLPFDAAILLHGTGSNFYSSSFGSGVRTLLTQRGLPLLAVNTRGHDLLTNTAAGTGARRLGSACEIVDECRFDVAAWCDALVSRGMNRIALIGHSLGAVKAIYSQTYAPHPAVAAVVAVSPPRLSHAWFRETPSGSQFFIDYRTASKLVSEGRGETLIDVQFPLPYVITAAGFVDKYGPDERYNILRFVNQLERPLLTTFGELEVANHPAFIGFPDAIAALPSATHPRVVQTIAGANHQYVNAHVALAEVIVTFLSNFPAS